MPSSASAPRLRPLPRLIFVSRWLQLPLYLGLLVAQAVYVWQFMCELLHLTAKVVDGSLTEKQMLWQTVIHCTFLLSAVAIAAVERILPEPQPH
jgi:uncharacterized membrane protein YqhA